MKKIKLFLFLVAAVVAATTFMRSRVGDENTLSDLELQNVEALSLDGEQLMKLCESGCHTNYDTNCIIYTNIGDIRCLEQAPNEIWGGH